MTKAAVRLNVLSGEATVWYASFNTGKTLLCLHLTIEAIQDRRD